MISKVQQITDFTMRIYRMVSIYGRLKLAIALFFVLLNGIVQVLGVTSIFPFIALISDPARIHQSRFGSQLIAFLPEMS
ncbi:MAG: hypothetical protein AAFY98_06270, partial [Verrucomicrobiota bacterium]